MDHPTEATASDPPPVPFRTDMMITAREVAAITGLSRRRIVEAADAGHLTVWRPPTGVKGIARYSRKSAESLARTLITPATANPEPAADGT